MLEKSSPFMLTLLQINDENVTNASHEYAVRLIKKSGSAVSLKVLRIMAFGLINAATLQKPTPSGKFYASHYREPMPSSKTKERRNCKKIKRHLVSHILENKGTT